MTALKIFPKNKVESTGDVSTNKTAKERGSLFEVYLWKLLKHLQKGFVR